MSNHRVSAAWRRALTFFFEQYLPRHRGFSPRTLQSYACALRLLLDRIDAQRTEPHQLGPGQVLAFLESLERHRHNSAATRNLRLAALKCFWKAMLLFDPSHHRHYEHLLQLPFKRSSHRSPDYLEPAELARLFDAVDAHGPKGFRDLTLLRYLYNTGSRISEIALARTTWLSLQNPIEVRIHGKGGKVRICPLWPSTAELLRVYLRQERYRPRKGYEDFLFLTRLGTAFTRAGLWKLIRGYLDAVTANTPSLQLKRLTPHSIRHSTAVHLLRAGVEINVIKAWLGHEDVNTTSRYLDLDLDKKREALERFLRLDIDRLTPDASALPPNVIAWLERV